MPDSAVSMIKAQWSDTRSTYIVNRKLTINKAVSKLADSAVRRDRIRTI